MMTQEFEYIDDYFKGSLSNEEVKIFEKRLIDEPAFAEDVAFYISAQATARDLAYEEKRNRFRQIQVQPGETANRSIKKWLPYVAAAALIGIIMLAGLFYFNNTSPSELPHQLANQYIEREFTKLGVTMSSSSDSIQNGIKLYNEGNPQQLEQALMTYERLIQTDSSNNQAIKYAGIVSLRLKQYDKALRYFQTLSNIPRLHSNPGKFYSAITLMERNNPEDIPKAKKLLQEVVKDDLEGRDIAENWLKKW